MSQKGAGGRVLELLERGQGWGVACIFRGVRTVENVHSAPKARATEGSGGLFRARKCHFPRFPGNSFINQNMTKR